jgi:sugar/nucleoside kinase (ribokinase family)
VKRKKLLRRKAEQPRVAGIGLVALDVVVQEGAEDQYAAGGTCGNVLVILAALGWRALPIARLAYDRASRMVQDDCESLNVDVSLLRVAPLASTPVIVERLQKDIDGIPYHRFSFFCPGCNRRYPGFQPVLLKSIEGLLPTIGRQDVLFVDRASASSVALARHAWEAGSTVFFEPSSANYDDGNFRAMLKLATIVKYSHDRIDELEIPSGAVKLEIQTLGRGGLRFRSTLAKFRNQWLHLDAEPKMDLVDTAGSGDWLSAGIIYLLGPGGRPSLGKVGRRRLLSALCFGQALAAWNCGFVGARGGMYGRGMEELQSLAKASDATRIRENVETGVGAEIVGRAPVCASCELHRDKRSA